MFVFLGFCMGTVEDNKSLMSFARSSRGVEHAVLELRIYWILLGMDSATLKGCPFAAL